MGEEHLRDPHLGRRTVAPSAVVREALGTSDERPQRLENRGAIVVGHSARHVAALETRGADTMRPHLGVWRSLVSALVWGTRGPRFKSAHPD